MTAPGTRLPAGTAPGTRLLVAVGPGLVADRDLLARLTATESAALGVPGRFVAAGDLGELRDLLASAGDDPTAAVVALVGPDPAARSLLAAPGPHAGRTVWYDPDAVAPVPVAPGSQRLAGRGVWGLAWAIRHAVHRLRRPARRIRYGPDLDQWGELRLPPAAGPRPVPVAVLLHGGFWRSIWAADLMDALAIDLANRGYAAWNLEYRRPDRHGWAATVADVAAGLDALAGLQVQAGPDAPAGSAVPAASDVPAGPETSAGSPAGPTLDLDRVAVFGHSAGGQLALRLAADTARAARTGGSPAGGVRVAVAVSLAGVVDLTEGDRRGIGTGAVPAALGGGHADLPEVYAAADPIRRLPIGVPHLVVQGAGDDLDLIDFNRRYVVRARAAGDEVVWLEQPGDHFAVIDPATDIWRTALGEVDRLLDH